MHLADAVPSLETLGWDDQWVAERSSLDVAGNPARVIRHDGIKVLASFGDDWVHATFARGVTIAVGDWVLVENETVTAVLPRRSELSRDLGDHGSQVIAANIDLVFLAFGVDREVRRAKVLRFLTFAWDIGIEPVIVLTKADLETDIDALVQLIRSWDVEVPIVPASVETGAGLREIASLVDGKTVSLIGESGAGKSSLVNALVRDDAAWVGDVRERDRRGRHTTTHREVHIVPTGGLLIDNPGVRSLGLASDSSGLEDAFADVEAFSSDCRFRDCLHESEPGCAVSAAVDGGELAGDRVAAYRRLKLEQSETADRVAERLRRKDRKTDARSARAARAQADSDTFDVD